VTGLLFPERLLRHNDDQHARVWPSHGLRPLNEDNTIRQDIREPSDTVSGKSGSQLLLQWTEVRIVGLDGRRRRWSARHRPDTWVGWLPCRHERK
jgi:hypothetical protein